jgi:hypothetical protein
VQVIFCLLWEHTPRKPQSFLFFSRVSRFAGVVVFIKRAGTDCLSHRLFKYGLYRWDSLRQIEFKAMTLTRPLTRRVGRDGLGRDGYRWVTYLLLFFKFDNSQITLYNSKKMQINVILNFLSEKNIF